MKNWLSMLGISVITGAIVPSIINISQQVEQTEIFAQTLYWNSDHNKEELSSPVSAGKTTESHKWYTFNIGSSTNFSQMRIDNSEDFSFSWGDTRYGPWSFSSKSINLDQSSNAKITDNNFRNYLQFQVYDETVTDFVAKMHSIVKIGYAWYQEGGSYYFQFLVFQYIHSINSFSGGANFANLGTNLWLN